MAKKYYLVFGSGNPSDFTGLTPTFTIFALDGLTAAAAPGITETPTGSGLYQFTYNPTLSIPFVADGGNALPDSDRYIVDALDPIQAVDEKIGYVTDSFGSTSVDPTTIFGSVKRLQEWNEGAANFNKSTGIWDVYSRGASTLLAEKTLTNTITEATKD